MMGIAGVLTDWEEKLCRKREMRRRLDENAAMTTETKSPISRMFAKNGKATEPRIDRQHAFNAAAQCIGRISDRVSTCSDIIRATQISAYNQEELDRETSLLASLATQLSSRAAEDCRDIIKQTAIYVFCKQAAYHARQKAEHYSFVFDTRPFEERDEEADAFFEHTQVTEIKLRSLCKRTQEELAFQTSG